VKREADFLNPVPGCGHSQGRWQSSVEAAIRLHAAAIVSSDSFFLHFLCNSEAFGQ
jgi:hypothetical protein